ncbi:GNAT family N-acetyltransferase [Rhodocytophaga aerolata]|uniref:GNAT family N-acetyltransferase n=1 Tax=Rhodocytophaga aerolata TaxID=455078 RepID=A0ABT8RHL9_9BACT|nr:GNAT family N-acetyltransferase [Rhodocytophaga aerolata]MDO1451489.1 GNAT family N-acetyltransferase [Rhodocytophaga aerolata]
MLSPFYFTLTTQALLDDEQAVFETDLQSLGLDPLVWTILNGSMDVRTPYSEIRLLRAFRHETLCGIAYIAVCKHYGDCLFSNPWLAAGLNIPAIPVFLWMQGTPAIDMINNPGFVSPQIKRADFVTAALAYLQTKFLSGFVIAVSAIEDKTASVQLPFADYGILDLARQHRLDDYLAAYSNIRKKMHKFTNKGGRVEVVRGALSSATQHEVINLYAHLKPLITTPFQDNYTNMIRQVSGRETDKIIHFLTYLNDQLAGYHSFAYIGKNLYCLSGAFDRSMHSTYHAYENMILETIRFSLDHQIDSIHYGPVLNPTKARMMNQFQQYEQRLYSRYYILKKILLWTNHYFRVHPKNFAAYVNRKY